MTDESGANDAPTDATESDSGDGAIDDSDSLDDVVREFLRDVDDAYDDYERGYVDADATLSVVMTHVERLRDARDAE